MSRNYSSKICEESYSKSAILVSLAFSGLLIIQCLKIPGKKNIAEYPQACFTTLLLLELSQQMTIVTNRRCMTESVRTRANQSWRKNKVRWTSRNGKCMHRCLRSKFLFKQIHIKQDWYMPGLHYCPTYSNPAPRSSF